MTQGKYLTPIRLLVVDDHNLFRRGLVTLLAQDPRFVVVAEAGDAGMAQHQAGQLQPDVILLDNHMPGVNGIEAIPGFREVAPKVRILMLTVSENEDDLSAALRAGANGYLLKTINTEDLSASILRVAQGQAVVSPEMMGKLVAALRGSTQIDEVVAMAEPAVVQDVQQSEATDDVSVEKRAVVSADDPIHTLSPREMEILALIAQGCSNKVIGRSLDIAETTVKIHVQHILRKLELSNRVHAAVYATERGIGCRS